MTPDETSSPIQSQNPSLEPAQAPTPEQAQAQAPEPVSFPEPVQMKEQMQEQAQTQLSASATAEALSPTTPMPSATVGMIEVEGVQIEMLSLSQLREQNLALEQAQAEAKAAKKKARKKSSESSSDGSAKPKVKRTRKTKAQKEAEAAAAAAASEQAESTSELELNGNESSLEGTETKGLQDIKVESQSGENLSSDSASSQDAQGAQVPQASQASDLPEPAGCDGDAQVAENPESAAEPSLVQTLLRNLISNVEQQEIAAAKVTHEEVEQAAVAESEALQLQEQEHDQAQEQDQGQSSSSAAASEQDSKKPLFPEPEWADMDELTPAQIERFSHMNLQEGDICPLCSNGLLIMRHSYKADFLGCSNFPQCNFHLFTGKRSAVVTLKELTSTCPECHGQLEVKKGRFGIFIGCSNYPACTYVYHRQDAAPAVHVTCPMCKKGSLVERRGRSGKTFYGCDNYPECSFSLFGVPVQQKCEECGFPVMYKKRVKQGFVLLCGDPNCASHRKKIKPKLKQAHTQAQD